MPVIFFVSLDVVFVVFFFFFSSRRRHTRCLSDWSSDVCSSDLQKMRLQLQPQVFEARLRQLRFQLRGAEVAIEEVKDADDHGVGDGVVEELHRSEERRVGKECRSRWSPEE